MVQSLINDSKKEKSVNYFFEKGAGGHAKLNISICPNRQYMACKFFPPATS